VRGVQVRSSAQRVRECSSARLLLLMCASAQYAAISRTQCGLPREVPYHAAITLLLRDRRFVYREAHEDAR